MEAVKKNVAEGVEISKAVRGALMGRGLDMAQFADKHGLPRVTTRLAINGAQRPTDACIAALVAELGGTDAEWRELLWLAGKPAHVELARPA